MKRPAPARRIYRSSELDWAIWHAGAGKSSEEIAEVIGETTGARIRRLLCARGIPLVQKTPHQEAVLLVLPKKTVAAAGRMAIERGIDPRAMCARLLEIVVAEKTLASNLLDDGDE